MSEEAPAVPAAPGPSEPTIVFVFELKQWYNSISPISKVDLLDIVPHVSTQFGYDHKHEAYLMVLLKSKWTALSDDIKQKFMLISRRIKEELDGMMSTQQKEEYERTDIFAVFEKKEPVPEAATLEPVEE